MDNFYIESDKKDRFNGTAECGYEFFDSEYAIVERHTHTFFEFFLVTEGELEHEINGEIIHLEKGDLVFVRDSDIHRFLPSTKRYTWVNVNFSRRTFKSLMDFLDSPDLKQSILSNPTAPIIKLSQAEAERCIKKFSIMHNVSKKNSYFFKLEVRKQLLFIFSTFFVQNDKRYFLPEWLDTLCSKMRDFENFSIGTSRMYQLNPKSKPHLIKSMQQYLNTTVSDFVNEQRINYATEQLKNTNKPIIDIALECGFNSINYFYRLFKQMHDYTPYAYRKNFSILANLSYSSDTPPSNRTP